MFSSAKNYRGSLIEIPLLNRSVEAVCMIALFSAVMKRSFQTAMAIVNSTAASV
jgi:hypothetical protein